LGLLENPLIFVLFVSLINTKNIIKDKERKSKVRRREMEKLIIRNDQIWVPQGSGILDPPFSLQTNVPLR